MVYLFWDIDGTLLTTARAGIFAWEEAVRAVCGREIDLDKLPTAGLTDGQVADKILEACGITPNPAVSERMLRRYERALPACLPRKQGQVLPGVRPILDDLQGRGDVVSMLLTGNTQAGAKAKLEHYGIAGYFRSGAFCDGLVDRPSIARKALGLAGEAPAESVYVIGDTPHDIHCGKAIGARTVAVASGPYSAGELGEHGPWKIFESLPSPDVFLRELGIAP